MNVIGLILCCDHVVLLLFKPTWLSCVRGDTADRTNSDAIGRNVLEILRRRLQEVSTKTSTMHFLNPRSADQQIRDAEDTFFNVVRRSTEDEDHTHKPSRVAEMMDG